MGGGEEADTTEGRGPVRNAGMGLKEEEGEIRRDRRGRSSSAGSRHAQRLAPRGSALRAGPIRTAVTFSSAF